MSGDHNKYCSANARAGRDIITFKLDDSFNGRTVELMLTLGGDSIDHYYEAFEAFLLAVGFVQDSIDRRYE